MPHQKPITIRQAEIVLILRNHAHIHGYMPTITELAQLAGKARGSVAQHLAALEARGIIRRKRKAARAIEILTAA